MENIHFIVNPIAGSGKHHITLDFLHTHFSSERYNVTIKRSTYPKHAIQLTKNAIEQRATIIVACGGDGTINEVASCLVGTSIKMGIIPIGSGNGLASNLNIPKDIEKAILRIKKQQVIRIDVGSINDTYFFSNTGVGFDASVIKNYEASNKRTLSCYVRAAIKSFRHINANKKIEIIINDTHRLVNPFMIFISNSNELGYNVSLTPKASLQDGLLDIVIVPQLSKLKILLFCLLVLLKKQYLLKEVESFQSKTIKLIKQKGKVFESQIDGELYRIKNKTISISIKEKCLHAII